MKDTVVVILNWNGKSYLKKFLPSVVKYSHCDIIVIDNKSTDDSINYLKQEYPNIKLIINPKNYGFAGGYNYGLEKIKNKYDYYILLNSDVEVTANWIDPIIDKMKSDNSIFAYQPKILSYNDKSKFEHAGAAGGFIDKYFFPFCRGRIIDVLEIDEGQYDNSIEVFWASGACMFVRASYFHEVNGFDDDFFAHMEEIDLCWRMKLRNKKIFFSSESTVYHVGGATLDYKSPRKLYLNFRNSLFMITKNYENGNLYKILFIRMCIDFIIWIKFMLTLNFTSAYMINKAHLHFFRDFNKIIKKRKENLSNINSNNSKDLIYKKSILLEFYLKGKRHFNDFIKY